MEVRREKECRKKVYNFLSVEWQKYFFLFFSEKYIFFSEKKLHRFF